VSDESVLIERKLTDVVSVEHPSIVTQVVIESEVVSDESITTLLIDQGDGIVLVEEDVTSVVAVGAQGPQGIPGISATSTTYLAAEVISGHRMVVLNTSLGVEYADNTTLDHSTRVLGLSLNAASIGDPVTIAHDVEVTEPSWNWVDGPIFLGEDGALIQSAPVSPALFSLCVGFSLSPTRMYVKVDPPVILA
jgi:hypothetical protein